MSEKPAGAPPGSAGSQATAAAHGPPAAAALDAHELGERLRTLRDRVDELRRRL